MYRWVYAIDESVRFFIMDINPFRLLIINAAILIIVLATYELLMSVLNMYVNSIISAMA